MRVIEKADIKSLEPLLGSIKATTVVMGVSERSVIDLIAKQEIEAVKLGRRTLVYMPSIAAYIARLPKAKGTLNPRRPRAVA